MANRLTRSTHACATKHSVSGPYGTPVRLSGIVHSANCQMGGSAQAVTVTLTTAAETNLT
jgi:hypothetical protein